MYDANAAMVIFTQRVHENPEKGWTYTADTQGRAKAPWRRRHNKVFKKQWKSA